MNVCGTCKHWGRQTSNPHDEYYGGDGTEEFRRCGAIDHDVEFLTSDTNVDMREIPEDQVRSFREPRQAVTMDGSGYFAALKCREDFGCVLWEPKDG